MSTAFIPNTTVTILDTGTTVDPTYGDPVANDVPVATGLPAFWAEKDQRTWDPNSQRATIIEGYRVKLRPGTTLTEQHRLRNERTGAIGRVNRVVSETPLGVAGDVVVRLLKISS